MVKSKLIKQNKGILGTLTGTYNNITYCKNGVIKLYVKKTIKKIKDV